MKPLKKLEEMEKDEQRAFLKKFKRPVGSRRAIGKKYFHLDDVKRMGDAIEKRARKALKRQPRGER